MQPATTRERLPRMMRLLVAATMALGLAAVPLATVQACSCAMPGTPAETVAAADLAFLGTVTGAAPAPPGQNDFGPMISYAFDVERSSADVGAVIEVQALGGDGGASCGFEFGIGERWFVAAYRDGGTLQTNLCSGNLLVVGLADDAVDAITDILPVEPSGASTPVVEDAPLASVEVLPIAVGGLGAIGIVAILVIAFREGTPRRPR